MTPFPRWRRLDIGLDVDNVLYPWSTVMTRWVEDAKGMMPGTLDDHALSWDWHKDQWGMSSGEFLDHYRTGVEAGVIFTKGDAAEGSVAMVRRLHLNGHRIHYITNREIPGVTHDEAWDATHHWLYREGFHMDTLTVSANKAAVPTDVFLDDAPANIEALLEAGHQHPLLWTRAHNAGSSLPRVSSFHEFEHIVNLIATERAS